ncbi:tuberin-like isoform X3 [Varroa destructor]|uniref:Rap-GAP domain-containing protein n=1 Tax=Varroa destructor TaxID=109461 RepID=A0A7M7JFY2_VARDE|nr:tuberin-like isoform X3 [Varroa destructor]
MSGRPRRGLLGAVFGRSRDSFGGLVESRTLYQFEPSSIEALSSKNDAATRLKCLRDIKSDLEIYRLEAEQISTLYSLTNDLQSPAQSREVREEVVDFYVTVVKTQFEQLGLARVHLFGVVEWKARDKDKEIDGRLRLLQALTKEGKCIGRFEREAPKFIARWMHEVVQTPHASAYLKLVINLVKYNSAFLDRDITHKFIEETETCMLCYSTASEQNVKLGLELLDCMVSYSLLRTEVLDYMVPTVCRTVLVEPLIKPSKQLMTKLLGTHLGRAAVAKMCEILEEPARYSDANLLRGAVVFLGLAMCPAQQDMILSTGHTAILVAMKKVLASGKALIAAEVSRTLRALLEGAANYSVSSMGGAPSGVQIPSIANIPVQQHQGGCPTQGDLALGVDWALVLDVVHELIKALPKFTEDPTNTLSNNELCVTLLSELVLSLERMADRGAICGPDRERLFEIVEKSPHHQRSEQSLIRLLEQRASAIRRHPVDWLQRLASLMAAFYIDAPQTLRLRSLNVLTEVIETFGPIYDEKLCENIIVPYLGKVSEERDAIVGGEALKAVAALCLRCAQPNRKTKDTCVEIIETVLNQPSAGPLSPVAIDSLVEIFRRELFSCSPHPIQRILDKLVDWINKQYCTPAGETGAALLDTVASIRSRQLVMDLLVSFRVSARKQLAIEVPKSDEAQPPSQHQQQANNQLYNIKCSPLVFITGSKYTERLSGQGIEVVVVNVGAVLPAVANFLETEPNWPLFMSMAEKLPRFLQDRQLMLVKTPPTTLSERQQPSLVAKYCQLLCNLMADQRRFKEPPTMEGPEGVLDHPLMGSQQHQLQQSTSSTSSNNNTKLSSGPTSSDIQQKILPILVVFPIHKADLSANAQRALVNTLLQGMSSKAAPQCIRTLTLVLLQMQDQMYRMAENVINKLAQVSDTKAVALPVLDFLSSLITLPGIFSSFTRDNYNKVFAIALPYTNSVKFSRYTVALAHHVIALWFLKCKTEFRPAFASFIMKRLRNYSSRSSTSEQPVPAIGGFEPVQRSRSGSLNERKAGGQGSGSGIGAIGRTSGNNAGDSGHLQLQDELVDSADDFLNQYSQGACSLQPRKSGAEHFLVNGGQSVTWVSVNKVITITTSGCVTNTPSNSGGVCEKCLRLCRVSSVDPDSDVPADSGPGSLNNSGQPGTTPGTPLTPVTPATPGGSSGPPVFNNNSSNNNLNLSSWESLAHSSTSVSPVGSGGPGQEKSTGISGGSKKSRNLSFELAPRSMSVASRDELGIGKPTRSDGQPTVKYSSDEQIYQHTSSQQQPQTTIHAYSSSQAISVGSSESILASSSSGSGGSGVATGEGGMVLARVCNCWCRNWGEITVRRPSGITSCTVRLQNDVFTTMPLHDVAIPDIATMFTNLRVSSLPEAAEGVGLIQPATPFTAGLDAAVASAEEEASSGPSHSEPIPTPVAPVTFAPAALPPTQKSAPSSPTEPAPKPLIQRSVSMTDKERYSKKSPRNEKYASIPEEPKSKRGSLALAPSSDTCELLYGERNAPSMFGTFGGPGESFRDRSRTISVMTATRQPTPVDFGPWKEEVPYTERACLSPKFLFSRLYDMEASSRSGSELGPSSKTASSQPQALMATPEDCSNTLEVLDTTLAYETHKIGVVYVDVDQQDSEAKILANSFGSRRYMNFLQGLGAYVRLKDIHGVSVYSGGLDTKYGEDGDFSIAWHDDVMQVMFHVATLMPTKASDIQCSGKKKHIGNDFVVIVYNNSGHEYTPTKSNFLHACIIVTPQAENTSLVRVWLKKELLSEVSADEELTRGCSIRDDALPKYARQLALHMNIASTIHVMGSTYVNNWLERLRIIRRLRDKLQKRAALEASTQSFQGNAITPTL